MKTTVVHCMREPYDIYVGRTSTIHRLERSKWGNPFWIGPDGTREEVLAKYAVWLMGKLNAEPYLEEEIKAMHGKRLGCWCRPPEGFRGRLLCHGQVLAWIANGGILDHTN